MRREPGGEIMAEGQKVIVVLTTGKQDRGTRATLALSWACSALALGKSVSVYMTMDGTIWAMDGAAKGIQVQGFEPLQNYVDQFQALGGRVLVCAPCSEYYCNFDRAKLNGALMDGSELVGLATVVSEAGPNCTVVTF
jgi:uncharacterized protein involved in oxidation of intracellular sulfur